MTAAQKVGGFRPPTATESTPAMSTPLTVSDASSSALQTNNPYRQASPSQGPASSSLSQPGLGDDFPSYDPPSYELATSTSPPAVDSKREQVPQNYETQNSYWAPESSQPPQPRQSPTSPQTPHPPQQSSSFMDQAMARLNPRDPLDPPPPCFSRIIQPPSATITYEPLPHPLIINTKPDKRFLDDAFITTGTPALYRHDVLAEDWVRLLEDIQITARLTGGQRVVAGALPVTMHIGFTGFLLSRAIERGMKRKNVGNVVKLLNIWNERFFRPRRLEIALCHGDWRASSEGDKTLLPAPDRPNVHARQRRDSDSSSSSSSSSSESEDETPRRGLSRSERRQMRQERRAERRARRDERRASRDARRAEKRARRAERGEQKRSKKAANYRLVVVSV